MISIGACTQLNKQTAADVCEQLQSRYGIPFTATHIGGRLDSDTATLYVHPADSDSPIFTAVIDPKGNMQEDYVPRIILTQIETSIQDAFSAQNMACTASANITSRIEEQDAEISVEDFLARHGHPNILIYLVFDASTVDASKIIPVMNNCSRTLGLTFAVYGYALSPERYASYVEDSAPSPTTTDAAIKDYEPAASFATAFRSGVCDMTAEELSGILEGK